VVMDTPGHDPVSMTGIVAGGANVLVFTTGRGSVFGCKPAPSIKVATNSPMYQQMIDDMDINAGVILEGTPVEKQLEARATGTQAGTMQGMFQVPYFYTAPNVARVNLAMEIPSNTVQFNKDKGKYHASLNVLGIAYKPDGSIGAKFSDTVNLDLEKDEVKDFTKQPYFYQNQFDAGAGNYKLTVVVSSGGDAFGKYESQLQIDPYDGKQFSLGGVVLTNSLQRLSDIPTSLDSVLLEDRTPLVVKGMQFNPSASNRFKKTDSVALYTQIYEPLLTSANPPQVVAGYAIVERPSGKVVFKSGAVRMDDFVRREVRWWPWC